MRIEYAVNHLSKLSIDLCSFSLLLQTRYLEEEEEDVDDDKFIIMIQIDKLK